MRTVLSEPVFMHYWQFYVDSGDEIADLKDACAGQRNGLCGAAVPGHLYLTTGLHTGEVGLTVEVHEQAPPVADGWQEVVEVSFQPAGEASVAGWGGQWSYPLDLTEPSYRVRYCAFGMEEGRAQDTRVDFDPDAEWYLLQFWPAPPQPDAVIRQTSETAMMAHGHAQRLPPPPTAGERAAAERQARLREQEEEARQERLRAERELAAEERAWGGRLPSQRLRELKGFALRVARFDRPLVDALGDADPLTQRQVARWVTRRAYAEAGLADIDWIAPALAAMDRGDPLPPPFDGDGRPGSSKPAFDRLRSDRRVPRTAVPSPDGRFGQCHQQSMALPAIFSARQEDPLRAALDALHSGAAGFGRDRYPALFTEVREAFPRLAGGAG